MSEPLTVVGSVNHDEILTVSADPVDDGTADIERTVAAPGGHAANVSVALARLGVPVRLVSAVGDDDAGRRLVKMLSEEGVDVASVQVTAAAPTGRALVVNGPKQHYMMLERGANEFLEPHHVANALTHCPGTVVVLDPARAVLEGVVTSARSRSMIINPAARIRQLLPALPDRKGVTVICNATEHILAAAGGATIWADAWDVVVTRGAKGCSWRRQTRWRNLPAASVAVVDPTGAGDAFTAGYAAAHRRGADPEEACIEGTRVAGLAVAVEGAWLRSQVVVST